jgi:hypothetical protein
MAIKRVNIEIDGKKQVGKLNDKENTVEFIESKQGEIKRKKVDPKEVKNLTIFDK